MEWGDFQQSSLLRDPNVQSYKDFSPPQLIKLGNEVIWTFEENKLFEKALTQVEPDSLGFFENIASRVPWRSMDDIRIHYQALVQDLEMIESGRVPSPDYQINNFSEHHFQKLVDVPNEATKKPVPPSNDQAKNGQQRRRGVPWTEEEHQLFLMGLNKYGKGDWRSISRYYVISKTPTQVASHAQKYFRRQTSSTPAERRRPSIHDIHTVNPISTTSSGFSSMIPIIYNGSLSSSFSSSSSSSCGRFTVLNPNFMNDISSSCTRLNSQSPMPCPAAPTSNVSTSAIACQLPNSVAPYSLRNQYEYWG